MFSTIQAFWSFGTCGSGCFRVRRVRSTVGSFTGYATVRVKHRLQVQKMHPVDTRLSWL